MVFRMQETANIICKCFQLIDSLMVAKLHYYIIANEKAETNGYISLQNWWEQTPEGKTIYLFKREKVHEGLLNGGSSKSQQKLMGLSLDKKMK